MRPPILQYYSFQITFLLHIDLHAIIVFPLPLSVSLANLPVFMQDSLHNALILPKSEHNFSSSASFLLIMRFSLQKFLHLIIDKNVSKIILKSTE